jgi:type I restriction enzyme, S subunit
VSRAKVMSSVFKVRLKYLAWVKAGAAFPDSEQGVQGESLPFYKVKHLSEADATGVMKSSGDTVSRSTAKQLGAYVFPAGTIVLAKVGAALLLNRFRALDRCSCIDNNMMGVMLKTNRMSIRFGLYSLATVDFADVVNPGAVPSLNAEQVTDLLLPVPPLDRQRAIADYLDRETARIDALISAKERVLNLLAEKRQALITCAVMQGIDPNVRLRDSEIAWLGDVPKQWPTRRVARVFDEIDERCQPDLPLLEVSIRQGVVARQFSDDRIEATAADFNTYKVARKGDVVFNKMRMWQGAVGIAPSDGLVSPDYVVARPTGAIRPDYAGLLFRTDAFSAECGSRSHGIVWDRLRLYWDGFREIEIPLPALDEQRAIVEHINKETTKLDALSEATERTIDLLKERRAALIAAAVTGQIDVSA